VPDHPPLPTIPGSATDNRYQELKAEVQIKLRMVNSSSWKECVWN